MKGELLQHLGFLLASSCFHPKVLSPKKQLFRVYDGPLRLMEQKDLYKTQIVFFFSVIPEPTQLYRDPIHLIHQPVSPSDIRFCTSPQKSFSLQLYPFGTFRVMGAMVLIPFHQPYELTTYYKFQVAEEPASEDSGVQHEI